MKKQLIAIIMFFVAAAGIAFAADITILSDKQTFVGDSNKANFDGNVSVQIDDVTIKGNRAEAFVDPKTNRLDRAMFYDKPYAYQVKNNKRNEVKANILKLSLIDKIITAEGSTQTIVTENMKPTIVITADSQEYSIQTSMLTARGAVVVNYKDTQSFSDKGIATITKEGEIKRLQLMGNAKITQKDNIVEGDHIDYDAVEENAIAKGNVHTDVTMGEDSRIIVDSNYQQYNKKANTMMASNNVRIKYKDYYAQGPKATVFPDKKTGKLNEVIFLGRSKITQDGKTIEADRIKMILKPKAFFAEGNVRTFIPNVNSSM